MANGTTERFAAQELGNEQQALQQSLESADLGGGTVPSGALGTGADVPAVTSNDPAIRQLLEESVAIRSGNVKDYVAGQQADAALQAGGGRDFARGSGITDSEDSTNKFNSMTSDLESATQSNSDDQVQALNIALNAQTDGSSFGTPEFEEFDPRAEQNLINQQKASFERQLVESQVNIRADFDRQRQEQKALNKNQEGGTQALLAASGATTFASGKSAMTKQIQRGQDALNELTVLENKALQAAQLAADNNDIAMLTQQMELLEKVRTEKNDQRQLMFENFVTAQSSALEQASFDRGIASENLGIIDQLLPNLTTEQLTAMDPEQFAQLEQQFGLESGSLINAAISRTKDNDQITAVDKFNSIISLGGIGSLSESDIASFAEQLGIPEDVIGGVVEAASAPNAEIKTVGGSLIQVVQNPDGTIEVLELFDSSSSSSSSTSTGNGPSTRTTTSGGDSPSQLDFDIYNQIDNEKDYLKLSTEDRKSYQRVAVYREDNPSLFGLDGGDGGDATAAEPDATFSENLSESFDNLESPFRAGTFLQGESNLPSTEKEFDLADLPQAGEVDSPYDLKLNADGTPIRY